MFLILIVNLCSIQRLRPTSATTLADTPLVSILVPARNEEQGIATCLSSLLAQCYDALEILVLDDNSSDATAVIVQKLIDELPAIQQKRLQLLHGSPLPQGWLGKSFACQQLAQQAHGEYLFFTDADTVHQPSTVHAVIDYMKMEQLQLLTVLPEQITISWAERLVIPLLAFKILTLLPLPLMRLRPEPGLAIGNGQLLCFQRAAYSAIGGHAAVKGSILEDMQLARAIKAGGFRMMLVDALELVRCHMYQSFAEVWAGFSKNLFALYNYAPIFALCAILLNLALFVAPALLTLVALFVTLPGDIRLLAVGAYALAVFMRVLLTLRFTRQQRGLTLCLCLLQPIAILLECLILLNSMRWHYRKRGTAWKGRLYT